MENIRGPPKKLLLESILEKSIERYGLRLLEGEKRYWFSPAYGYGNVSYDENEIRKVKTVLKALKLKIHPLSKPGNILYELIRIYNLHRDGFMPIPMKSPFISKDCIPAGKDIEVARFRAGLDWARISLWYFNGEPSPFVDLDTCGDFSFYMVDILDKALIENKKEEVYRGSSRINYEIKEDSLKFVVPACIKYIIEKYESYLNYSKRQIQLSDHSANS